MNQTKYNSLPHKNGINKFLDDFFNHGIANVIGNDAVSTQPAVNIIEAKEAYRMEFAAPGLQKENFKIEIDKNNLRVSSVINAEENNETEVKYNSRQFAYNNFSRSFKLPESVDQNRIEAAYTNGILVITLFKKQTAHEETNRKIEIK